MPASFRRRAAQIRQQYTGESDAAARAGIGRRGSHGLDECSEAQSELRSVLARGLLNRTYGTRELSWSLSMLLGGLMSPRYDSLVVITSSTLGFVDGLVPNRQGKGGLPGLRLERTLFRDTGHYDLTVAHVLRHIPSDGQIVVTNDPLGRLVGEDDGLQHERRVAPYDLPVLPHEHALLRGSPRVSSDARVILAAVVCRLSTSEPGGGWALGSRHGTPSSRWRVPFISDTQTLTGEGDHWVLRWSGHPPTDDLVGALTDPTIGLAEATVTRDPGGAVLQFGTASLRLEEQA